MKKVSIDGSNLKSYCELDISGSKSESNRILILKSIFNNIKINNLSSSDDTSVLNHSLQNLNENIDVGHAGTSMRFLTAYLATLENKKFIISGSDRMHQRPIGLLVDALNSLGFRVNYLKKRGFPPLEIIGSKNLHHEVVLKSHISSQFVSALTLIAPSLDNGLRIILQDDITSKPYINMTLSILNKIGVDATFEKNLINVKPTKKINDIIYDVESDWSSVSYFFSMVALTKNLKLSISNYKKESFQGDVNVCKYYETYGVKTVFEGNRLIITKDETKNLPKKIEIDLNDNPDLAQTIVVTSFGLNIPTKLTGLSTLKVKETNRLEALYNELTKLGAKCKITNDSIEIFKLKKLNIKHCTIDTYDDHRMALAFAPLSILKSLEINEPSVVSKSFPEFWKKLKDVGFSVDFYN